MGTGGTSSVLGGGRGEEQQPEEEEEEEEEGGGGRGGGGGGKSFRLIRIAANAARMTKMMTQLGGVGGGRGRGGGGCGRRDWCEEECLSSLHVPDEGLLGGCFDAGWCDGDGVNWRGLTGRSCPASGTGLPTEKTIARRTQLTRQPRLVSQGSLRPIDAFTLNQECYSSGKFSGKNILDRSRGLQSSLLRP
jgi:hypothetical protein